MLPIHIAVHHAADGLLLYFSGSNNGQSRDSSKTPSRPPRALFSLPQSLTVPSCITPSNAQRSFRRRNVIAGRNQMYRFEPKESL
ncbi:hypothetical protein LshimejAT787_1301500 [Lyophyllum shimeji]|uniref:Uncharacterized protein n=1 Tax=Lyophyllum shimeji TaxID=47721 RepID=A0A9P3PX80_LYOSH|nr:hypothetical protein LshimejAT787_1301500 [Lyophyllum shimeji]